MPINQYNHDPDISNYVCDPKGRADLARLSGHFHIERNVRYAITVLTFKTDI